MAIKHLYTVTCDRAIRDTYTGNISIIDAFSNVTLPSVPCGKSLMYLLVGMTGDEGEEFTITLEGPGNLKKVIAKANVEKDLNISNPYSAHVTFALLRIEGLMFEKEGIYYFSLRQGKKVIHKAPMGVFVIQKNEQK